ncbi:MAG TPA: hypothetical protein VM689_20710 [Aliidongia sp.]|nr:hypothetical protein [Aliidongia sp.]
MNRKLAAISGVAALALAVAPLQPASAHRFHGGLIFGLAAGAAAVVAGAAVIATAPIRAIAAAPVYAPPPVYAAPPAYYYAPPPAYYAPPAGYYYGR